MRKIIYTLMLTGMVIIPVTASAQTLTTKTTLASNSAQNLSQTELNAIKEGQLTNKGQPIPVDTQIMMSTGNLDGYTVRKVQQSLSDRGYYKGSISGKWDSETAASMQAFQKASGDHVDESGTLISSGTLARLGVTMDKLTAGDANSEISHNPDLGKETRGLAGSKMSPPGQTVPAPDNGPKSTLTRDAVASGRFNKTIDGSAARGTTDGTALQNNTTANNPTAGIAGTRSDSVRSVTSVAGNSNLSAGSTSSANVQTTGSLQATASPQNSGLSGNGTASNNVDGRAAPGSPPTSSSALGGRAVGSLSNSASTSATGSSSGIANSGGSLSDGSGSGTSQSGGLSGGGSSGASSGTGSLSGSGGGSSGGGGGGSL